MRLDKCLSNSGYGSRSEVKLMIRNGKIAVNSIVIKDPAFNIDESDFYKLSIGDSVAEVKFQIHLMMHKPAGLITAMDDRKLPTIADIIPECWSASNLFPVGRLDRDTTGLLILTNDGTLCHRLTGPRWGIWKTYRAQVRGKAFSSDDIVDFAAGLELADKTICRPAKLEIIDDYIADLTIHEGKYHQVKRMMLGTGRRVLSLHRWRVGPLILDSNLEPGMCRELTDDETASLYDAVKLSYTGK